MNNIKKKILFLIPFFLLIIAIIFFLIIPLFSEIIAISMDINDKKITLENKSFLGKNIKNDLNKLNEIKNSQILKSSLISPGDELVFIEILEKIAKDCNLEQDINIGLSEKKEVKDLAISIKLEGDYINLLKYLTYLEKEKYYININSLDITSSKIIKNAETNKPLKLSINGTVFLR